MPKRKSIETSLEAYRSLDPIRLSQLQQDIVRAVTALGEANYEAIASFLMLKPEKVWKRLSETERKGLIYKPGNKIFTKNGCWSYTYKATQAGQSSELVTERFPVGKSSNEYAKQIIQNTLF